MTVGEKEKEKDDHPVYSSLAMPLQASGMS